MGEPVGDDPVGADAPLRRRLTRTGRGRLDEDVALGGDAQADFKGALHLRTQALGIAGSDEDVVAGTNLVDGRDMPLLEQMMVPKTVTHLRSREAMARSAMKGGAMIGRRLHIPEDGGRIGWVDGIDRIGHEL